MESESKVRLEPVRELCEQARVRIAAGDYNAARCYLHAAQEATSNNQPPELLRLLADLVAQLDSFSEGALIMERALDGFRLDGNREGEIIAAADLAALLQREGRLGQARNLTEWALNKLDPNDRYQRSRILNIAATVLTFQGRLQQAGDYLRDALPLAKGRVFSWVNLNAAVVYGNLRRFTEAQRALEEAANALTPDDLYTPLMLAYARAFQSLLEEDYAAAYIWCQDGLSRMSPTQHPIVYFPTLATMGVLAREANELIESKALLLQALKPLTKRVDKAATIGIYWHLALLSRQQEKDTEVEQWLRMALHDMQTHGYGLTLLWQPQRFAELCEWACDRGVEVNQARWLLQTTLAPWIESNPTSTLPLIHSDSSRNFKDDPLNDLSPREREVLAYVARGMRSREIADCLHVSVRTVQNHLQRCYEKLGVHGRVEAVKMLLETGRVDPRADHDAE